MWKVLLVEDELFVRESIKETIHWEELGFTISGEAGNGEEALALMKKEMPDLVITDIIMPKMDGLELLRAGKALHPGCKFIMLSAMGDFEYVQQALEEGASSYILKLSMSVQSLRNALQKIADELSSVQATALPAISDMYRMGWEAIYHHMLDGQPLQDQSKSLYPKGYEDMWLTICCALAVPESFTLRDFENQMGWDPTMKRVMHSHTASGITTLFVWSSAPQHVSNTSASLAFPHGISFFSRPEQLLATWQRVLSMLDAAWYELPMDALREREWYASQSEDIFPWSKMRKLIDRFEQHHLQQCKVMIDEIWAGMASAHMPLFIVKQKAKEILEVFTRVTNDHSDLSSHMDQAVTHEQLKQYVLDNMEECLTRHIKDTVTLSDHPEVNKIIVYIQEHFDKDITVKWLAQYIAMDENYISSLFKQKMAISIIQYLHKVRVEKAMYYLQNTDLPISTIGEKVGFNNDNYFIKIFKRWYHHTPSHYRKIHRKKQNLQQSI